jgi:hypothetical protein
MKTMLALILLLSFSSGVVLQAAESTKGKKTANAKKDMADDSAAGKQESLVGMMSIKPAGAADDVIGVIVAKHGGAEKAFKVIATGELVKQIDVLRKNGTRVKLTGVVGEDTIKVAKAEDGGSRYKK